MTIWMSIRHFKFNSSKTKFSFFLPCPVSSIISERKLYLLVTQVKSLGIVFVFSWEVLRIWKISLKTLTKSIKSWHLHLQNISRVYLFSPPLPPRPPCSSQQHACTLEVQAAFIEVVGLTSDSKSYCKQLLGSGVPKGGWPQWSQDILQGEICYFSLWHPSIPFEIPNGMLQQDSCICRSGGTHL